MSIEIEVSSTTVEEKSGMGKNGKPYLIREQVGYAFVLDEHGAKDKYPVKCRLPLETDQAAYRPGIYTVDPRSFMVGDYDRLALGRVRLAPRSGAPAHGPAPVSAASK